MQLATRVGVYPVCVRVFSGFFDLLFGFKCMHRKLTPLSNGSFCPDCGLEIEISWLILRCKCCNSKRKARVLSIAEKILEYFFSMKQTTKILSHRLCGAEEFFPLSLINSIKPEDKFCVKCGASECEIERKENLEFFDIEYAVISKKEADSFAKQREVLQIWIESVENSGEFVNNVKFIPLLKL